MASTSRRAGNKARRDAGSTLLSRQTGGTLKLPKLALLICGLGLLVSSSVARAQDADKQKLTDIENKFAANATLGPVSAALLKQYLLDATVFQVTNMGRIGMMPKAKVIEMFGAPDPSDPNVKTAQKISDVRIQIYGETALVGYKLATTDTGHKDAALNVTDHLGCLDTFVKRNGSWFIAGDACSPDTPISKAEWDAAAKARSQMPKDIQDTYH